MAIGESVFDIAYLLTVLTLGIIMICQSRGNAQYRLFGIMAVVLGAGDAFHLVPRVMALTTDGLARHTVALGIGKWVTSVTMTVFYVLLYLVWRKRYRITGRRVLTAAVWLLAVCRVVLCFFPQNRWLSAAPPLSWGIYRNIPFTILGLVILLLFYRESRKQNDRAFRHMSTAILVSFACYLPVVLFADRFPPVGALMLPKTCAYVWAVLLGYFDMKGSRAK
ncbi:hypothetical protein [Acidaminobacterium chupaoyuni]